MLKKIRNLKFVIRNCQAGMTYVELIVVLSIFAVMSSVVMFNYGEFQAKVDIKNLASDIALKIVEAQKSSLNGLLPLSGYDPLTWKPSYGVYFNSSADNDTDGTLFNKKFIYFADLDQNYSYGGLPSCTTAECLDKILITKNNSISKLEVISTSCTGSVSGDLVAYLDVVFKRPDSGVTITADGSRLLPNNFSCVQITIVSPKTATATIKIYPSGRVQVN